MWHRIGEGLRHILGPREREPSAPAQLEMYGRETQAIYDQLLRRYLRERFGADETQVARILTQYEDWLMTAVMRLHVVSVDEEGVLIPVRLLDALAAELGLAPITTVAPAWVVDDELDARHRRSADPGRIARSPEEWLSVVSNEHEVLRRLTVRYGLTAPEDGAT